MDIHGGNVINQAGYYLVFFSRLKQVSNVCPQNKQKMDHIFHWKRLNSTYLFQNRNKRIRLKKWTVLITYLNALTVRCVFLCISRALSSDLKLLQPCPPLSSTWKAHPPPPGRASATEATQTHHGTRWGVVSPRAIQPRCVCTVYHASYVCCLAGFAVCEDGLDVAWILIELSVHIKPLFKSRWLMYAFDNQH